MIRLFRFKSKIDRLNIKYRKLMKEWHELSSVNRAQSDAKYTEAQKILIKIDELKYNKD